MVILVPCGIASVRTTSAPVALTVWVAPSMVCVLPAIFRRTGTRSSTRCARRRSSEVSGRVSPGFTELGAYCLVVTGGFQGPTPKNDYLEEAGEPRIPRIQDVDSLSTRQPEH